MVFLEASRALDPEPKQVEPSALLELTVLREDSQFPLASFLEGARPDATDEVPPVRLVHLRS